MLCYVWYVTTGNQAGLKALPWVACGESSPRFVRDRRPLRRVSSIMTCFVNGQALTRGDATTLGGFKIAKQYYY